MAPSFYNEMILALWLLLPAAMANGIPPIMAVLLPHHNFPMDFYLKIKGKRIFGEHKTLRGILAGTITGLLVWYVQTKINLFPGIDSLIPWYYGAITGFAALSGDAVKSFFKRQLNIHPGKTWVPFDQVDWIIGHLIILAFYIDLTGLLVITSLLTGFILHILGRLFGVFIGVNKQRL